MNTEPEQNSFSELIQQDQYTNIPSVGDIVEGKIISNTRRELRISIDGFTTGVIRGRELFAEAAEYRNLKPGDSAQATIIDLENENGEMELSFRFAGQKKAWDTLRDLFTTGQTIETIILEANKGGLIVRVNHISGFLPVSQLSPDHYPRVTGGDKSKILEKLKDYIGTTMTVRVIDVNEPDEKLIVSEKAIWEQKQKDVISKYKVGNVIEGDITAIADFGAFVKFDGLEGLVHISEIAWQRIDHPRDLIKIGQTVQAQIIGLEGTKIFLSMKKLMSDPWTHVEERYKVGDDVEGKVLKINPFGFFVELDPEIHGLAHVSELSEKSATDVNHIAKPGDVLTFKIVSIEPQEHRLGLSLKQAGKPFEPTQLVSSEKEELHTQDEQNSTEIPATKEETV